MEELPRYPGCFVCGDNNPHGFNARFYFDGHQAVAEVTIDHRFEGYHGICHGGITASLLDEVMVKAILAFNVCSTTAEITIRYLRPVQIGDRLVCYGRITESRGRAYFTEGEIVGTDGQVFASATGKYIAAADEFRDQLLTSLE